MCLNPGDLVSERYQVIRELGRGGFGITYTAYDIQQSDRPVVVLKQIALTENSRDCEEARDRKYLSKIETEAKILKSLKHPRIPQFFDSFKEDNYYYIVQEYIEGEDLSKEILPGEPLEESQAINILQELLDILQFIHQNNIIHRDIKPANIVRRDRDKKLFLIDFGAVKEVATEHTNDSGITVTKIIQSKGYTPVEQLDGQPRLNSDIYALGMTMMQAVTGFSVNRICNPQTIPKRDINCNYLWQEYAPQISPWLKEIISKMIEYSFNSRYKTAGEILFKLESPIQQSLWQKIKQKNHKRKTIYFKIIKFLVITLIGCLLFIFVSRSSFFTQNICNNLGDNLSCGEEILDPLSQGSIRFKAAQKYGEKNYQAAFTDYQLSWQKERRDAESLIYLNNSLLEASKLDYYTIAIAVPLSSDEKANIQNSKLAQHFLRGIAQAQTEINLGLLDRNPIFQLLPGKEILEAKKIGNKAPKGLRVIVVDDGNNLQQAQETAKALAKIPNLLGIVGNYASEMTLATVDIYDENNLAQISFGTTTKRLSTNHRPNFFRVVYTNNEEAETIIKYIQSIEANNKKVTGFYNPKSDFSNYLWIEIEDRLQELTIPTHKKAFNLADDRFNSKLALNELSDRDTNILVLIPDGQVTNALSQAIAVIQQDKGQSYIVGGNSLVRSEVTKINNPQETNLVAAVFWHPLSPQNPRFLQQSQQLWQATINNGTAVAYDASISLIEAIKQQAKPSRKGTIASLANKEFTVKGGATGSIKFNSPENGDRLDFYPTLVRLLKCDPQNHFVPLFFDRDRAENLVCKTKTEN